MDIVYLAHSLRRFMKRGIKKGKQRNIKTERSSASNWATIEFVRRQKQPQYFLGHPRHQFK